MLNYILYIRVLKGYIRTNNIIRTNKPLLVGEYLTYNQLGINRAIINRLEFENGEFRVYIK